jgi:hypothetical protein
MGHVARIWEEYDIVLSMTSTPGGLTPSSSTAAALGPACARGENSKPGCKMQPKVNGASRPERADPTTVHRDSRSSSSHAGPFAGGLHGTGRGACTWRLNTVLPVYSQK